MATILRDLLIRVAQTFEYPARVSKMRGWNRSCLVEKNANIVTLTQCSVDAHTLVKNAAARLANTRAGFI